MHFRALEGMLSGPVATVVDREDNWLTINSHQYTKNTFLGVAVDRENIC